MKVVPVRTRLSRGGLREGTEGRKQKARQEGARDKDQK